MRHGRNRQAAGADVDRAAAGLGAEDAAAVEAVDLASDVNPAGSFQHLLIEQRPADWSANAGLRAVFLSSKYIRRAVEAAEEN
jgi:hypothetical protein